MITNEDLPYSTGNSTQYSVMAYMGKESKKRVDRDFSGGPVVQTPCFHRRGAGSIPGQGTKIPHAAWHGELGSCMPCGTAKKIKKRDRKSVV